MNKKSVTLQPSGDAKSCSRFRENSGNRGDRRRKLQKSHDFRYHAADKSQKNGFREGDSFAGLRSRSDAGRTQIA